MRLLPTLTRSPRGFSELRNSEETSLIWNARATILTYAEEPASALLEGIREQWMNSGRAYPPTKKRSEVE